MTNAAAAPQGNPGDIVNWPMLKIVYRTDADKIGMQHAPEIVRTVAEAIDRHSLQNVVFDPVMVATSGAVLIEQDQVKALGLLYPTSQATAVTDWPLASRDIASIRRTFCRQVANVTPVSRRCSSPSPPTAGGTSRATRSSITCT